jgi:hypothetical protein
MAGLAAVTTAAGSAAWFAAERDRLDGSSAPEVVAVAPAARRPLEAWPQPFIVRVGNPHRTTNDERQHQLYLDTVSKTCARALEVMRPGDPDWLDDVSLQELNAARASFGTPPVVVIELPSDAALLDPSLLDAPRGCW